VGVKKSRISPGHIIFFWKFGCWDNLEKCVTMLPMTMTELREYFMKSSGILIKIEYLLSRIYMYSYVRCTSNVKGTYY